jgi:hypothetical protein
METWDEVKDYLLDKMDAFSDDDLMVGNSSLTKEQYWNSQMGECIKYGGEQLPIRTKSILLNRLKKNFG